MFLDITQVFGDLCARRSLHKVERVSTVTIFRGQHVSEPNESAGPFEAFRAREEFFQQHHSIGLFAFRAITSLFNFLVTSVTIFAFAFFFLFDAAALHNWLATLQTFWSFIFFRGLAHRQVFTLLLLVNQTLLSLLSCLFLLMQFFLEFCLFSLELRNFGHFLSDMSLVFHFFLFTIQYLLSLRLNRLGCDRCRWHHCWRGL